MNMHSIRLIVDESDSDPEPRYKPYTNEEAVAVTTVVPTKTAADRVLATFDVKKPQHDSPKPANVVEAPKKEQTKNTSSSKTAANSSKPAGKAAAAAKPIKKVAVQKAPLPRSAAKGKEKAQATVLSTSTSVMTETDSLADEDQVMGMWTIVKYSSLYIQFH